eukprot:TRINITY_DN32865_c0_g1_i1.p1 TRINITY_DN32865_c0_g1~~TRINITY_DN32865_c0_g1_i1.p1  ORF type:complete len:348 (+),score=50.54 TRINITY_DN32865_c0_g1_i1:33-1076(+)
MAEPRPDAAAIIAAYRQKEHNQLTLNDPANSPRSTRSSPRELIPNFGSLAVPPWTRELRAFRHSLPDPNARWKTPAGIWVGCESGPQPVPSAFRQDRTRRFLGETTAYTRNYSPVHAQAFPYCPDRQNRAVDTNMLSGIGHTDLLTGDPSLDAQEWLGTAYTKQHDAPTHWEGVEVLGGHVSLLGTGHVRHDDTGKKVLGFIRTGSPAAVQSGHCEQGCFYPKPIQCHPNPLPAAPLPRKAIPVERKAPRWDRSCSTCSTADCHVHRQDDVDAMTVYQVGPFTAPTTKYQYSTTTELRPKKAKMHDPGCVYDTMYSDRQLERFEGRVERAEIVRRQTEALYAATGSE